MAWAELECSGALLRDVGWLCASALRTARNAQAVRSLPIWMGRSVQRTYSTLNFCSETGVRYNRYRFATLDPRDKPEGDG